MIEIDSVSCTNNSVIVINPAVHRIGANRVGKELINDVPRIPVKTAPADTIAIVDARIEDVISFDFWPRTSLCQRGFLVNTEILLIY